jgi:GMP synthase (glutamine-hydrolysing)
MKKVLILDFGSQFTQLIARRVRELNIYSEIRPYTLTLEAIKKDTDIAAIILSGGPNSIYDTDSPQFDDGLFSLGVPILGICYGLQLLGSALGGDVEASHKREYGRSDLTLSQSPLWHGINLLPRMQVWMSHGDHLTTLPNGFDRIGRTENCPIAAIGNDIKKIYGLQFHPEVAHTAHGTKILSNFLEIAGLKPEWTAQNYIETMVKRIKKDVGSKKVLCGLSGGVDSGVAAALIHKAIGDNLQCMFIDHGLLRMSEREEVIETFQNAFGINLVVIDASELFLSRLEGVSDPEKKRKIIGNTFIEVFETEANKLGNFSYLAQGTLYPDVIESVSFSGGPSHVIKSHHNVGGLPEKMKFKLVEPLRELFKDEVREVGKQLGLPDNLIYRHPFPGPGLAIRTIGNITEEKLTILRKADNIFIEELKAYYLNINEQTHSRYLNVWEDYMPRYSVDRRNSAHAIIYNPTLDKYLIQVTDNNINYIYPMHLLGGGIHNLESHREALFREIAEEAGLSEKQFKTIKYLGKVLNGFFIPSYHRNREIMSHMYYLETDSVLEHIQDKDDKTVLSKWVTKEEAIEQLLPSFDWVLRNYNSIPDAQSLYEMTWQAFCVLTPIQSVGVMGDGRTYEHVLALRSVDATDGMTADWSHLPYDFLAKVSNRITNEVKGVNRVVYDISSKPPSTIEWE